jgi:hypothetical protein
MSPTNYAVSHHSALAAAPASHRDEAAASSSSEVRAQGADPHPLLPLTKRNSCRPIKSLLKFFDGFLISYCICHFPLG